MLYRTTLAPILLLTSALALTCTAPLAWANNSLHRHAPAPSLHIRAGCEQPEAGVLDAVPSILSQYHHAYGAEDPSQMSILITLLLQQKLKQPISIQDTIKALPPAAVPGKMSLLEVRDTLRKLGYDSFGYQMPRAMMMDYSRDHAMFLVDHKSSPGMPTMSLLYTATDRLRYVLYADDSVCPMTTARFEAIFADHPLLLVSTEHPHRVMPVQLPPTQTPTADQGARASDATSPQPNANNNTGHDANQDKHHDASPDNANTDSHTDPTPDSNHDTHHDASKADDGSKAHDVSPVNPPDVTTLIRVRTANQTSGTRSLADVRV